MYKTCENAQDGYDSSTALIAETTVIVISAHGFKWPSENLPCPVADSAVVTGDKTPKISHKKHNRVLTNTLNFMWPERVLV